MAELEHLAEDDAAWGTQCTQWPGSPSLVYVDNNFHARLLAMTRLGRLLVEIETGWWQGIPRTEPILPTRL